VSFHRSRWYSTRVEREVTLARWGHFGQPVLIFPTAGGDAEEIERWLVIRALAPLIGAGRIKVYSCDSVAGQAWFAQEGSLAHRMWLMNQFQEYVRHEVVPAIYEDCRSVGIPIWTAGASIGALHAVATVCRYPDVFQRALAMSGTYDLMRFTDTDRYTLDYHFASPMRFVPLLEEGSEQLERARRCFVMLASGAGRAERMSDTWEMSDVLGQRGIPNWVDPWGADWPHDWQTWRAMMPKYFGEWTHP
jgi:esterase/lipase superfamily enzyme